MNIYILNPLNIIPIQATINCQKLLNHPNLISWPCESNIISKWKGLLFIVDSNKKE